MKLFTELTHEQEVIFRQWARDNYEPFADISGVWHPVVQDECVKMNAATELPQELKWPTFGKDWR
jgi:hypothetical protein